MYERKVWLLRETGMLVQGIPIDAFQPVYCYCTEKDVDTDTDERHRKVPREHIIFGEFIEKI